MTELQTDTDIQQALRKAAGQKMTQQQVREQRISFVMGTVDKSNNMTRAEVEKLLSSLEGLSSPEDDAA